MRSLALLLAVTVSSVALAQPMMMDPSKMSGIPRPDPQVPAGTITVRLIRGQLANRMTNVAVSLKGPSGEPVVQKTDGEGRATFAGLDGTGPFIATAKEGDVEMTSQPMELQAQMGTRVMLVFPLGGAGAPDGTGHVDKTLPAGTLVVRAEDAGGQALEGLDVVVGHATKGASKTDEVRGKTDTAGEAKFDKLAYTPTDGYIVQVRANGASFDSKPFRLESTSGTKVVLLVRQVSGDLGKLSFGEGSHFIVEVTDDTLQVIEVLRLHNESTSAVDAGGDGLHIPLPANALSPQAGDNVTVVGHEAIFRGPVPPGDTQLRFGFVLKHEGGVGELIQRTPIPFAHFAMVTQEMEGLQVTGPNVRSEPRDMQGRKITVHLGDGTQPNGTLDISFHGLPHATALPRYAAAALALLIVIVLGIYATGGDGGVRSRLEDERRKLFDELTQIDVAIARGENESDKREKKVARLAKIYRDLDELGGG